MFSLHWAAAEVVMSPLLQFIVMTYRPHVEEIETPVVCARCYLVSVKHYTTDNFLPNFDSSVGSWLMKNNKKGRTVGVMVVDAMECWGDPSVLNDIADICEGIYGTGGVTVGQ